MRLLFNPLMTNGTLLMTKRNPPITELLSETHDYNTASLGGAMLATANSE